MLSPTNISKNDPRVGAKAWRLALLVQFGFQVPPFVVVSRDENIDPDAIVRAVPASRYAVRSSAAIEDADASSHAGQFLTVTDVKPAGLAEAIAAVRASGSASVIVQEYIEPDISGVAFTRSPQGGRELVVEWHHGRGSDLVSGKIKPKSYRCYWTEQPEQFADLIVVCKKIETAFGFPQDIEWCVRKGVEYILQTRPITSINKKEYDGMRFLDETLPRGRRFHYEKTEVSEFAPRPTPAMLDLLRRLYASNGPIARAYRRRGVRYQYQPFIIMVGSQLYVDRDAEKKTLFPNFVTTVRNAFALAQMKLDLVDATGRLTALERNAAGDLLKDYEIIFDINLCAAAAFKRKVQVREWEQLRVQGRKIAERHLAALERAVGPLNRTKNVEPDFPPVLTNTPPAFDDKKPRGVSAGVAEGVLVDEQAFRRGQKTDGKPIVFLSMLTPDLARALDRLVGIISERGGELSHLAIVARERGIPVVVNTTPRRLGITFGARVRIDGGSGEIQLSP